MRSGVSFPYYEATFSGGGDADFPASNLADLVNLRRVFKFSGGTISFTLPGAVDIGLVAVCAHNAGPGATMNVSVGGVSSGAIAMAAPGPFMSTTPWCPATPVTASSGTITLSGQDWLIGGVEIAGFWQFHDVSVPRQLGVNAADSLQALMGADHTTQGFPLRTFAGERSLVDVRVDQANALDFIAEKRGRPFVWVWDADDPTTFAHECFLARSPDPGTFSKGVSPTGSVSFKFQEHLG